MHDVHIYNRRNSISLFTDANHINVFETEKPTTRKTMKETKKSNKSHNFYITIIKEA